MQTRYPLPHLKAIEHLRMNVNPAIDGKSNYRNWLSPPNSCEVLQSRTSLEVAFNPRQSYPIAVDLGLH